MYFVKKSDMIQLYIMGKMQKCAKHKQLLIVLCIMGGKKKVLGDDTFAFALKALEMKLLEFAHSISVERAERSAHVCFILPFEWPEF